MKKILVDANCIGSISLFALKDLRFNEVPTTIIYGFLRQLQNIYKGLCSNNFIMCWDSKSSLRKRAFPEYKCTRKKEQTVREREIWQSAYEQFSILRTKYLPQMGFTNQLIAKGFEADDLMADISEAYDNCTIVTTDGDLFQCLPHADIWNPRMHSLITAETFEAEWGIHPEKWGEAKAIAGCRTDAVPGVVGVGEKTAIKFLNGKLPVSSKKYKAITQPESQVLIKRNRKLVILPFKGTPEFIVKANKPSFAAFEEICKELGMFSLLKGQSRQTWKNILKE